MTFNHRVIRFPPDGLGEQFMAIHEVYYRDDGSLAARTENAVWVGGESLGEMREELERMLRCLEAPVIDDLAEWPGFGDDDDVQ